MNQLLSERSQRARAAFHARVTELGGTLLETEWRGTRVRYRARCAQGHDVTAMPDLVLKGQGFCRICSRQDPEGSWKAFQDRVAELGGTVLEPKWLGGKKPHLVRCPVGHVRTVYPGHLRRGKGMCYWCGRNPVEAWAKFCASVAALGGTVLEPKWLGDNRRHRVRCKSGHESQVWPGSVRKGHGICRVCAAQAWNVFYVVVNDDDNHVKVGITSGDPRPRLHFHRRDGFTTVVRLLTDFPNAYPLECDVKATLKLAGEKPVRGFEYFDVRVLATILDVVDHYPPSPVLPAQRRRDPRPGAATVDRQARSGVLRNGIYYMRDGVDCVGCGHAATSHGEKAGRCWVLGESEWMDCPCTAYTTAELAA